MPHLNETCTLVPGILCEGTEAVVVRQTAQKIDISIAPKTNESTVLYFQLLPNQLETKYNIDVHFHHDNAEFNLFGLYQLSGTQKVEIQTTMHHFVPHCTSQQVWRGVLHDAAFAAFEGKIIVHPNAEKTIADLSNKNLLLSDRATVTTKPILEINTEDVRCTHGATVGHLDENALFYCRSRGMPETLAREILIQAFMNEVLEKIPNVKHAGIDCD